MGAAKRVGLLLIGVVPPGAGDGDDLRVLGGKDRPGRGQPVRVPTCTLLVAESNAAAGMVRIKGNPHRCILIEATDSRYKY